MSSETPSSGATELPGTAWPLGARLALSISLTIGTVALVVAPRLAESLREELVLSKQQAVSMTVGQFAAAVGPALDFEDLDAARAEVLRLSESATVEAVSVWVGEAADPVAATERGGAPHLARPSADEEVRMETALEERRLILRADGSPLGALAVRFSLADERARAEEARRVIFVGAAALASLLSGVVWVLIRSLAGAPLAELARAARKLRAGQLVPVVVRSGDEVGQLAAAFNVMAATLSDREGRLAETNRQLQQLLDHMGDAIVVFGPDGVLTGVRSRYAEVIFGSGGLEGRSVVQLLHGDDEGSVTATALAEWVRTAFALPASAWASVEELAPREVTLHPESEAERVLGLEFRPIEEQGAVARVMLIAVDRTDVRRLERAVAEQERDHERQMSAMRRLVAGGGHLLVSVLARARERLAEVADTLGGEAVVDAALVERLFQVAHSVKGEARAFDLHLLERAAASLEDLLAIARGRLRAAGGPLEAALRLDLSARLAATRDAVEATAGSVVQASPIGADILEQVTVRRSDVAELGRLAVDRTDRLGEVARRLVSRPFGEAVLAVVDGAPRWAERDGRALRVEVVGREVRVPPALAAVLPSVITHLARNAVAHGVEQPDERVAAGKPEVATLRLAAAPLGAGVEILVSDDGRGLDSVALLRAAAALGAAETDARSAAFRPGVTTATGSDLAGRGVGLGAAREELAGAGYSLELHERPGGGVEVRIRAAATTPGAAAGPLPAGESP